MKEKIYELVKNIPAGKVMTYGQIATCLGNKNLSRAVGNALHCNPDPTSIPCHRVVNSKGKVSSNYAFGGSTAQRMRLEQEGVVFKENGMIDLELYGF